MGPTITCRDTDDREYWADRLNAADQEDCEALLFSMLKLGIRLRDKGIPAPGTDARLDEGEAIYAARFGEVFVPF